MTRARIFQPTKTAMQSGRANTRAWVLEFEPAAAQRPDPLMGWSGSKDTMRQVRLTFDSRAAAENYARRMELDFEIKAEEVRRPKLRSYSDNFRYR